MDKNKALKNIPTKHAEIIYLLRMENEALRKSLEKALEEKEEWRAMYEESVY